MINGVKYEYEVYRFSDTLFSNTSDHVQTAGMNDYLDHDNDFSGAATDTTSDNSGTDFENGTAIDGGNYQTNMPSEVLSGVLSHLYVANDNYRWYEGRIFL